MAQMSVHSIGIPQTYTHVPPRHLGYELVTLEIEQEGQGHRAAQRQFNV